MKLVSISWYTGLILCAGIMLLVLGDPSAALLLAIVLPISCLVSTRGRTIVTTSIMAMFMLVGGYLATRPELDPSARSTALSIALATPLLGLLTLVPHWIVSTDVVRGSRLSGDSADSSGITGDQSSTKFMSDSMAIGSLGRLTPETNRSRAA